MYWRTLRLFYFLKDQHQSCTTDLAYFGKQVKSNLVKTTSLEGPSSNWQFCVCGFLHLTTTSKLLVWMTSVFWAIWYNIPVPRAARQNDCLHLLWFIARNVDTSPFFLLVVILGISDSSPGYPFSAGTGLIILRSRGSREQRDFSFAGTFSTYLDALRLISFGATLEEMTYSLLTLRYNHLTNIWPILYR